MDNGALPHTSGGCIRGPRQAAHRRCSCNRALSTHRKVPEVLGRSSPVLHLERHLAHSAHGWLFLIKRLIRAALTVKFKLYD